MMDDLTLLGFGPDGWAPLLLKGCLLTLAVSATSMAIGTVLGVLLAWARLKGPRWLRRTALVYGVVLRGVPELLVILLLYFGLPSLILSLSETFGWDAPGLPPPFLVGSLSVGLVSAAYQAEIFRGGVGAIPRGQFEAARAMGFGDLMCFHRIVLPQVTRIVLPALGNVWQFNLKDSALIAVTGLSELMRTSLVAAGSTRHPFLFFGVAMALYLVLTTLSSTAFHYGGRYSNRWDRD
ncbi:ABC transporter permease [Nitrospirillum viridazoti]|uniref:Amino acid ABC transporter membrane protein 1 (PAAT family) n=1 Tax=Nitrospirillum amazonense TaxID=28077 RepID=A0A560HM85_9PROT|nr:ABC transporter permease subunit [Nitrospirillum amazonense]TWB47657.1 amino acid ABC transporter membrane protein 1 (PAAT family) [Nitrospirillum amazonense]